MRGFWLVCSDSNGTRRRDRPSRRCQNRAGRDPSVIPRETGHDFFICPEAAGELADLDPCEPLEPIDAATASCARATTRSQVIEVTARDALTVRDRGDPVYRCADRASPEVVAPAGSVGAKRQRRLASAAARRSYRAHCEPPPPQGRSSFVPPRTTRRQPGGSPIPQSLPRRCRTRCPQRGAQHPSQPSRPQWSGSHRRAARSQPSPPPRQPRRQHAKRPPAVGRVLARSSGCTLQLLDVENEGHRAVMTGRPPRAPTPPLPSSPGSSRANP